MNTNAHEDMVRRALQGDARLCPQALDVIAAANRASDLDQVNPERHFDNCASPQDLVILWRKGFNFWYTGALECSRPLSGGPSPRLADRRRALEMFGQASHALQDFYAHSNWIEKMEEQGDPAALAPLLVEDLQAASLPAWLETGYYSLQYGLKGCPECDGQYTAPAPYHYCHETLAKDHPDRGHGGELMKDGRSTYYQQAIDSATRHTQELWADFERRLEARYGASCGALASLAGCEKIPAPRLLDRAALALGFLTRLPVRLPLVILPGDAGRSAGWFPLVGLLLGVLLLLAHAALRLALPPLPAAALTAGLWALLTGFLHLDGLADCCDALFAAAEPPRRLEILKDPHLGTFGAAGLLLHLLVKTALLASLPGGMAWGLLLAPSLARWLALPAARQKPARPDGLGADLALGLGVSSILLGALVPLALTIAGGWRGLLAAALAGLSALALTRWARRSLGGVSGDVLGLVIEAAESAVLLAYALSL